MTRRAHNLPVCRRPRPCRRRGAFTLVEVLATLVLIGIVIPVAMRGVTVALAEASKARHQAEAATLAEAKLNEMIAQGDWNSGGGSGDFSPDYPQYKWTATASTPDANINVTQVDLSVTWNERGQDRTYNVSTFVYANANGGVSGGISGGLP
jgi:general secretion pathway protein I